MSSRISQLALYWLGLSVLASSAGLPRTLWVLTALAALAALLIRHPGVRYGAEVLLVAVTALAEGSAAAALLTALMGAAALNVVLPRTPSPERAIGAALITSVIATYLTPWAAVAFIPIAAFSLWALLGASRAHPSTARPRVQLATGLAVLSALGAVAIAALARIIPWRTLLGGVFSLLALPFRLFSEGHPFQVRSHINPFATKSRKVPHPFPLAAPNHAALWVIIGLVALLAIAAIIFFGRRYWSESIQPIDAEADPIQISRETLSEEDTMVPLFRSREKLTPVRHFVRRRHEIAQDKRKPGETLRDWLRRIDPGVPDEAIRLYEEIRYGDREDTASRRRTIESLWNRRGRNIK